MNEAVLDLQNIDSQEKAFLLFRHVILGASFDYHNNFYVKHNSLLEATYISEFNKTLEFECQAKGLLPEKDKLKVSLVFRFLLNKKKACMLTYRPFFNTLSF